MTTAFSQDSNLQQAHETIRASRSNEYFARADRFSTMLAEPLAIEQAVEYLTGTNMSALDRLFEDAPDVRSLNRIVNDMQALTDPAQAQAFSPAGGTLDEAVKTHVAFLTARGYARLKDKGWTDDWLRAWQHTMLSQNRQQFAYCSAVLDKNYRPPRCSDFKQAVACYLDSFGETGALGVTVIGALPFSAHASLELLDSALAALKYLSPLLRMAQDAHVDTTEGLNVGIFATAATRGLSASEARSLILEGAVPRLQKHLTEVYQIQGAKTQGALAALPMNGVITALVEICLRMADQIASTDLPV
jgi:hypothetical protein